MNCPELVSDYSHPAIKWYQTDLTVVISIQLPDVSNYYIRIEDDCLQFSTETNGKKYYVVLHMFGSVIAEKTVHKNVGREIKIYLKKGLKWYSWLRLLKSKEKTPLISYDPAHIQETTILDYAKNYDINRFQKYKLKNNIHNIMPVVPSSDEDESDDDDYFSENVFSYG
ncbi:co-chaperone protein p23-1 [Monomorium pharaonis]|uniref:co-chaperone protein p23-1 n=1 Tax=Monomorium pharaonis TaxID=307658 RepID=UPI00063F22DB|nr:co-chaperone protein p23-1 [Monomorium pharaonis]